VSASIAYATAFRLAGSARSRQSLRNRIIERAARIPGAYHHRPGLRTRCRAGRRGCGLDGLRPRFRSGAGLRGAGAGSPARPCSARRCKVCCRRWGGADRPGARGAGGPGAGPDGAPLRKPADRMAQTDGDERAGRAPWEAAMAALAGPGRGAAWVGGFSYAYTRR
jgi:hypothetical protein